MKKFNAKNEEPSCCSGKKVEASKPIVEARHKVASENSSAVKLLQPKLVDFTKFKKNDHVVFEITKTEYAFAPDSALSGQDWQERPIFKTTVYVNDHVFLDLDWGLPFVRFAKGSRPRITYKNHTLFTFNLHYHGLNTVGSVDGASMEDVFGHSTSLGPKVTFDFPEITNNQSLLWYHSHNMFISMELAYGGLLGLLQIVDEPTKWLNEVFEYGDNQLLLAALDMDFDSNGSQTPNNLVTDENRSAYTVINGVSSVNWYTSGHAPFTTFQYHHTSKNLVKIDLLNAALNWRVLHIGVCDKNHKVKPFWLVQSDAGLINPKELTMCFSQIGGRLAIIIDLNNFENKEAYLFFYNYDLTEIFDTVPTHPHKPNNTELTGTYPDIHHVENSTPYPSPIPDPNQANQQQNPTALDYPEIETIPQIEEVLDFGEIPVPKKYKIKPFLKIRQTSGSSHLNLKKVISGIRKTIFSTEGYQTFKKLLKEPGFEYNFGPNYINLLNKDYYYNLPQTDTKVPIRNIFLFGEDNTNALEGGNLNGTTEYIDGANRIMADAWNSAELDLDYALHQYSLSPNNYKPDPLPTSKFRILKTDDRYSNITMISNDTLKIEFYDSEVAYGDFRATPLYSHLVIFKHTPPNKLMNIQEWVDFVNQAFSETLVTIPNFGTTNLSNLLTVDWSFFPYALNFEWQKTTFVKSAVIKTTNHSPFWIRFCAKWPLLQMFGKPLTGTTIDDAAPDVIGVMRSKLRANKDKIKEKKFQITGKADPDKPNHMESRAQANPMNSQWTRCDEVGIFGIYDAEVQDLFPGYATAQGDTVLPIACMKRSGELIIEPEFTYIGLYDGFFNDNVNSFSVKLNATEQWIYVNGDGADAHAFHVHMTSGFASPQSSFSTPGLLSENRLFNQLTYSRDIYQIGPQQVCAFYITWNNYPSYDATKSPTVPRGIGAVIHCHLLAHFDANSMFIQYFIDN
jgi:FtsP/CotA-like multicopper oxidase with cupredoxin domain